MDGASLRRYGTPAHWAVGGARVIAAAGVFSFARRLKRVCVGRRLFLAHLAQRRAHHEPERAEQQHDCAGLGPVAVGEADGRHRADHRERGGEEEWQERRCGHVLTVR
jgi:hypothetical protein